MDYNIAIPISKGSKNEFLCIVYNFGNIRSSNPGVYAVNNNTFCGETAKSAYHTKYLRISWTYLDLLYRFGSHIGVDDYSNICLVA